MPRFVLVAVVALAGCSFGPETPGEAAERKLTRDLNALYPGIDVEPAANCLRDEATDQEIAILGASGVNTQELTRSIFQRPDTLTCLQANGVIEVMEIDA